MKIRVFTAIGVLLVALLSGSSNVDAGAVLFVVDSTGDEPDAVANGACDIGPPTNKCTLRAAFSEVVAGTEVHFDIPGCPPACTISPNMGLPSLKNNNLIDGTTQPGYSGAPLITIDGTNINDGPGINLGSSRIAKIKGLVVRDLPDDPGISGGGVEVLEITDTIVSGNAGPGLTVFRPLGPAIDTPSITIINSQFVDNSGDGVLAGGSGSPYRFTTITDSTFNGNGRGIWVYASQNLNFYRNQASHNFYDGALLLSGYTETLTNANLLDNVFEGNGATGVTIGTAGYLGFDGNEVRNNVSTGADLGGGNIAPEINEILYVANNVIEDNDGTGFRSGVTGTVTIEGNTVRRNGGDGGNIQYEQYVGSGYPPPSAMTVNYNTFEGNFGMGLSATDYFLNFSLTAANNTLSSNGQGMLTSAYSLSVTGNTFTLHPSEGFESTHSGATGSITENTFTLNESGIYLNSAGISAHFNRITGNQYGFVNTGGEAISAENNWWGCNDPVFAGTCDIANGFVDFIPYLVLTPSADPNTIPFGGTSSILADFRINSNAEDTSAAGHIPDGAMVEFGTDLGSLDGGPTLQAPTSGGVAGVTLTADEGPGTAHVTMGLDNAGVPIDVVITGPSPTPTPSITPVPTPTPTPTATPSPTPGSGTPTPTPAEGGILWGDSDCGGVITLGDAINIARFLVSLVINQQQGCPGLGQTVSVNGTDRLWEDVDCSGVLGLGDAIGIARHLVSLPVNAPASCPEVGQPVEVAT